MAKYRIILEFETNDPLNSEVMNDVSDACFVQLESLSDGDLPSSEEFGVVDYKNATVEWSRVCVHNILFSACRYCNT